MNFYLHELNTSLENGEIRRVDSDHANAMDSASQMTLCNPYVIMEHCISIKLMKAGSAI